MNNASYPRHKGRGFTALFGTTTSDRQYKQKTSVKF